MMQQSETEDIFRELCMCNGLSPEKIAEQGPSVTELEMFFSGYPRMVGLLYFPNLVVLTLVKQDIGRIEGLEACPLLTQLWIAESHLVDIEGLDYCTNLQRLYLYYNQITQIKNLENLTKLEILWLNSNNIKVIEGLNTLTHLKELNLAGNLIDVITDSLDSNVQLEWLNLSGNRICSFKELTNLTRLPELQILSLKDPQYAPNPVTLLCNYMTHVVYHIPKLLRLDTYDVSSKLAKDFAESTVMKKKMYYSMRVKNALRQLVEIVERLKKQLSSMQEVPKERIKTVNFCIKALESELALQHLSKKQNYALTVLNGLKTKDGIEGMHSTSNSVKNSTDDSNAEQKICKKLDALKERLMFWNSRLDETEARYQTEVTPITEFLNLSVLFLLIELETVGNIRFEEGTPSDVWFTSCYDVILSRFCAWDFKKLGVTGLKINRIIRVHNRMLRLKYEDKIQSILSKEGSTYKSENYSKHLEYLFYVCDPELSTEQNEVLQILEGGFKKAEVYRLLGRDEAVPLCNSMSLCEQPRIGYLQRQAKAQNGNYVDPVPFRYGQLIIAKVFLGHSIQAIDTEPVKQLRYPNANSVYRPRKVDTRCANDTGFSSSFKLHGSCDCSLRQYEWFVFDHDLVVPEYFIDFEYITQNDLQSFYSAFSENKTSQRKQSKAEIIITQRAKALDEEVMKMDPVVKQRPKILNLDEMTLLSLSGALTLSQITILNLQGNNLSKLKGISKLTGLQKLTVSFNELAQLDDFSNLPHLTFLDASHNRLTTLDGFNVAESLKYLDLSWNQLTYIKEEIGVLRKHAFDLLTLDLRHNPWKKPALLRPIAIGQLKALTYLNGIMVTEEEALAALHINAESRLTQVSLLTHSRTDEECPRCLSLLNSAQNLTLLSKMKPNLSIDQTTFWYPKITTLNLDGQNLSQLTNLDKLQNLRWASFNNNSIRRFEGLDHCLQLEELSLEDNFISELEGISKLTKLTRLNLGNNQLKNLEGSGLDKLTHLHHLSLEGNKICSLRSLQKIYTLIELYMGNNLIHNNCEIYHLKGMENLVILDLYGNPVVYKQEHYRLFVIYHLPSLRAFDGTIVEPGESENAKDVFGGRLTADMVTEKLGHSNFSEILKLEMSESAIRSVDLGPSEKFGRLQRINLEHNNLTSFSGLVYLPRVKVLYLNHNHIETILPRQKPQLHLTNRQILQQKVSSSGYGQPGFPRSNRDTSFESLPPVMESLEVLHLGYNGISSLVQLQLNRLINLRVLYLEGNFISQIEGLDRLQYLAELSLERNRVRMIHETSFLGQSALLELHLEENRMRDLNNLYPLVKLQRLFLGANKIQDIGELEKLDSLPNMTELSVVGNPVSRKMLYRPFLVFRLTRLQILDGVPVTMDEKERAEFLLCEHSAMPSNLTVETGLSAIMPLLTRPNTLRATNCLPKGLQPFSAPEFNLPHGFGDSIPQETARNKKYKHLGGNLSNPRSFQPDIICRQMRSGGTYQPSFMQQQRDSSRNMRTLMQIHDQDSSHFDFSKSILKGRSHLVLIKMCSKTHNPPNLNHRQKEVTHYKTEILFIRLMLRSFH
ncbi:leucine-rich repeat-containing protein 9 isoform X4 [Scyliorhinus torazame]|uniref:leucine-rich repeat-containing protein 9 isoform X4 n=1 Tax=Scyliorhinus torazame TaxID=75743 RepID=UPI003B5CA643